DVLQRLSALGLRLARPGVPEVAAGAAGGDLLRQRPRAVRPGLMASHAVCGLAELPAGQRRIVEVEGRSIGVFNVHGSLYALPNVCPHQGAPLCLGLVTGLMRPSAPGVFEWTREGEILRCPWHGWEFD